MNTPILNEIIKTAKINALGKAVAFGGVPGALIGANVDEDDATRGAILGALTGTGIGYGITSGMEASARNKELFQKLRRAQRNIENEQGTLSRQIGTLGKRGRSLSSKHSHLFQKQQEMQEVLDQMQEPSKMKVFFSKLGDAFKKGE